VRSCASSIQAANPNHSSRLTLSEARFCARGAPEFSFGQVPRTDSSIFIVTAGTGATINHVKASPGGHSSVQAAACWNDWKTQSVYFTDVVGGGSITGTGYGNHCGHSDFPSDPNIQVSCGGCHWSADKGHYDNAYGMVHWGQNYAGDWANINLFAGPGEDTFLCRVWIDPNASIWSACY